MSEDQDVSATSPQPQQAPPALSTSDHPPSAPQIDVQVRQTEDEEGRQTEDEESQKQPDSEKRRQSSKSPQPAEPTHSLFGLVELTEEQWRWLLLSLGLLFIFGLVIALLVYKKHALDGGVDNLAGGNATADLHKPSTLTRPDHVVPDHHDSTPLAPVQPATVVAFSPDALAVLRGTHTKSPSLFTLDNLQSMMKSYGPIFMGLIYALWAIASRFLGGDTLTGLGYWNLGLVGIGLLGIYLAVSSLWPQGPKQLGRSHYVKYRLYQVLTSLLIVGLALVALLGVVNIIYTLSGGFEFIKAISFTGYTVIKTAYEQNILNFSFF